MQTAGIYLRISDDREGKRLGVQRQQEDCTRLATNLGLQVVEIAADNDISAAPGSSKPRPEYNKLLTMAKNGQISAIIAYSTSRLTRRTREHEDLIDLAIKYGIKFHFVASPAFDLNTADGREMARSAAVRDTGEVERLQERILRKKLADAEDGKYPGGRRCYAIGELIGVNPANGKEVRDWSKLDHKEAAIIRLIGDRILQGDSQMLIVKDFKKQGILTSLGYPWTVGKLKRTLLNPSYVQFDPSDPDNRGTRIHGTDRHRAIWPAIFTQVEHDMLVNYFNANPYNWQQGHVIARSYLLSGFTVCGLCGGACYGQARTERGVRIRRYHCKKYNTRGETVGCSGVVRRADAMEYLVTEAVLMRFDSPEVARALTPVEDKARVQTLTEQVVTLQRRKQMLAAEHALEPYEDYGVMLSAIKSKMEASQGELNRLRSEKAKKAMVPALGQIRDLWADASLEWKASVIRLVVDKVIIHPSSRSLYAWEGYGRFDPDAIEIVWSC